MSDEFDWNNESDETAILHEECISVYLNLKRRIVIRQKDGEDFGEDSFIILSPSDVEKLVGLLRKVKKEGGR